MNYKLIVLMCLLSILSIELSADVIFSNKADIEEKTLNPAPDAPTGLSIQTYCTITAPTIADLEANGDNIQWYESEISTTALNTTTSLISGEDYFATQTVAGCESTERLGVTIFLGDPNPPSAISPQEFCTSDNPLVGDIIVTGTNIKWYESLASTIQLSPTTPLANNEDYYATQTVSSCESILRFQLIVTLVDTPSPSANGTQEFCAIDNPIINDLVATGSNLIWYAEQNDDTPLVLTEALADGEDYFASQTINGCESSIKIGVLVTVNDIAAPTGNIIQTLCMIDNPTIADLQTTGTNIIWYEENNSTTALSNTEPLVDGENYFATQTVNACESDERLEIIVDIEDTPAPTTTNVSQEFCAINNPKVADLEAPGSNVIWYEDATTNTVLVSNTGLVGGEDYFATQTINGCESGNRLQVNVFIFDVGAPTTSNPSQTFCGIDNPTVADLLATGVNSNIAWYADLNGISPLSPVTPLINGEDYFAADSINDCEGTQRLQVDVVLEDPSAPTTSSSTQILCSINNPTLADLEITGSGITWYGDISSDAVLPLGTPLVDGEDYYATQTLGTCESDVRLQINVLVIDPPTPTTVNTNPTFCVIDNPTLSDIFVVGTAIQWYDDPTMTLPLPLNTSLVDSEEYYVAQTVNTCESALPLEVIPNIEDVLPPSTNDVVQSFCSDQNPTLADINVTSTGTSIQWYDDANNTTLLPLVTALVNGEDYFVSQIDGGCESSQSLEITVEVVDTPNNSLVINVVDILICQGDSTNIQVLNAETNVEYQLIDISNSANVGTPIIGTGGTIDLPTGLIIATTFFNVVATSTQFVSCQSTLLAQATVVVDDAPTTPDAGVDQFLCNQASTTMEGNTPDLGTGTWTQISGPNTATIADALDPVTGISGMIEGTYAFEWQISNGVCINAPQFADTVEITTSGVLVTITLTRTSVVGANDGVIGLCAEGGTAPYSISWEPNNVGILNQITSPTCNDYYEISELTAGMYEVVITDASGCSTIFTGVDSILLEGPDCSAFEISMVSFLPENCFNGDDGRITIETTGATGNVTYDIGNDQTPVISAAGTVTFDNLAAGDYMITVIDELLCEVVYPDIITIIQPDPLEANITIVSPSVVGGTDGVICIAPQGGVAPYAVTADCGTVIEGSSVCGGDFYVENLGEGICNIQIVDFTGCIITEIAVLQDPVCDGFEMSAVVSEAPFCNGGTTGSIEISVTGGTAPYQYSMDGGVTFTTENSTNFIFENVAGGSYDIVVLDVLDCSVTSTQAVEVTEPAVLIADLTDVVNDCSNTGVGIITLVVFGGTPDYIFLWSDGTETAVNENLIAGDYTITVTDGNGCTVSGTANVANLQGFDLELQADGVVVNEITIGLGESVELSAITDAVNPTYEWIPIDGLSETNIATVIASPTETTEYVVSVMDENGCILSASIIINVSTDDRVVIPNSFSPNNDGINDIFYPILEGTANVTEFKIYNRWGQLIHNAPSIPWDGTYKGKEQLLDTYVYIITYETDSTPSTTVSGDILLVR
jgi:gliding motility-associated-like protein